MRMQHFKRTCTYHNSQPCAQVLSWCHLLIHNFIKLNVQTRKRQIKSLLEQRINFFSSSLKMKVKSVYTNNGLYRFSLNVHHYYKEVILKALIWVLMNQCGIVPDKCSYLINGPPSRKFTPTNSFSLFSCSSSSFLSPTPSLYLSLCFSLSPLLCSFSQRTNSILKCSIFSSSYLGKKDPPPHILFFS